ncbi:unnamed protein product [Sphacelaria rigidula]
MVGETTSCYCSIATLDVSAQEVCVAKLRAAIGQGWPLTLQTRIPITASCPLAGTIIFSSSPKLNHGWCIYFALTSPKANLSPYTRIFHSWGLLEQSSCPTSRSKQTQGKL